MNNGRFFLHERTASPGRSKLIAKAGLLISGVRAIAFVLALALAGCATQQRAPDAAPPVHVSKSTWWQVDSDIAAASLAAKSAAGSYAENAMEHWRGRVYDFTEADFIPWFTGYWTQQWLAIKVAWYQLGGSGGVDPAVQRLAKYLQEQYQERVLAPVAEEVNPDTVRAQATNLYVQRLGQGVRELPQRHKVPLDQFERRLAGIPAIALAPPPNHNASLLQLVHAEPVTDQKAYAALLARLRQVASGEGAMLSDARISPVAKRASEKLVGRFAASGGASAAAAAVGGVVGLAISLGVAGFGAIAHESDRPQMVAETRASLDAAADEMWLVLTKDPVVGVMAGVNHIARQIEESLSSTIALPLKEGPMIGETFLADEPIAESEEGKQGGDYDYDALEEFGAVAE